MTAPDVIGLIRASRGGDRTAVDRLFESLYAELRRVAHRQLGRGRPGALDTTTVVHEVYVKLTEGRPVEVQDRGHFMALAARAMRQVIVDEARRRGTRKRGGDLAETLLDESAPDLPRRAPVEQLLVIDESLSKLDALDPRLARVVEWRFFGGMTDEEIAGALGVTARTVRRDWRLARAFLFREIAGPEAPPG
jgi:RNA polymerase sigma factor (TIGR02999 family)